MHSPSRSRRLRSQRRQRHLTLTAVVAVAALGLMAGCGTNVPKERIQAAGNGGGGTTTLSDGTVVDGGVGGGTTGETGSVGTTSGGVEGGTTGASGSATTTGGSGGSATTSGGPGGSATTSGGGTGSSTGSAAGGSTGATSGAGTGATSGTGSGGTGGTGGTAQAACAKPLSPVVLGQSLAASGLVGAAISNLRTGLAVWAKDVNARGGVQCHPVNLIQLDSGSDPARVTSNFNELARNRKAVAMVGSGEPIAIAALRSAAESSKIPVVGGDLTATDWGASPYLFPQGGAPIVANDGGVVGAAKAKGGKRAGLIYCVEASICTAIKNNFPNSAKIAKTSLGAVKASSLTQPDFTSECQSMKDDKVDVLFLALDGSASTRAARSCASLGYKPTIATNAIAVSAQAAADPNLKAFGTYLGTGIVPFSESSTPGSKEFRTAVDRFAGGATVDQSFALGWAAGKLFEAAVAKQAAKARAGDITTALILEGLWSLKNETLNGLSPGVSFTRNAPPTVPRCFYGLVIDSKGYRASNGSTKTCV